MQRLRLAASVAPRRRNLRRHLDLSIEHGTRSRRRRLDAPTHRLLGTRWLRCCRNLPHTEFAYRGSHNKALLASPGGVRLCDRAHLKNIGFAISITSRPSSLSIRRAVALLSSLMTHTREQVSLPLSLSCLWILPTTFLRHPFPDVRRTVQYQDALRFTRVEKPNGLDVYLIQLLQIQNGWRFAELNFGLYLIQMFRPKFPTQPNPLLGPINLERHENCRLDFGLVVGSVAIFIYSRRTYFV